MACGWALMGALWNCGWCGLVVEGGLGWVEIGRVDE